MTAGICAMTVGVLEVTGRMEGIIVGVFGSTMEMWFSTKCISRALVREEQSQMSRSTVDFHTAAVEGGFK